MIALGSVVGFAFATLVFSLSVHGIPMLLDRDIDFMTAIVTSMSAVLSNLPRYLAWGCFIGTVTLVSTLPLFIGLFLSMPILGHATWHLYVALSKSESE